MCAHTHTYRRVSRPDFSGETENFTGGEGHIPWDIGSVAVTY